MGEMLGWANLRSWMWVWIGSELVGLGHWDRPLRLRAEVTTHGEGWGHFSRHSETFESACKFIYLKNNFREL